LLLEAAVVRCGQNRSESRYETECVNARQAVSIIEAKEERIRAENFEKQSNRKREALRRTQQAAAEARRRAADAERRRKEAAYLAQFGELPQSPGGETAVDAAAGNAPSMVIPEASEDTEAVSETVFEPLPERARPPAPVDSSAASDGGNAPAVEADPPSDLNAIREELRKRNEDAGN